MFAPLVAAGTGSFTMYILERPVFAVDVPALFRAALGGPARRAPIIAIGAVLIGLVVLALSRCSTLVRRLRHPVVMLTIGGLVLGVLGAIGGQITLFKGLEQMRELVLQDDSAGQLVVIVVVKCLALLVAATCGFRGGRIFPRSSSASPSACSPTSSRRASRCRSPSPPLCSASSSSSATAGGSACSWRRRSWVRSRCSRSCAWRCCRRGCSSPIDRRW